MNDLKGRVAIITGGSRGIGREVALALAKKGCHIVIAAKTIKPHPTLPGTIYTVCKEVEALGVKALPVQVDIRNDEQIDQCIQATIDKFNRIDILINNASALWWRKITETPMKKYDLINSVNVRGTFALTRACLPYMVKNNYGRVITMSPPIRLNNMAGHTAYNISKFGMTLVALGVAAEYEGCNITGNSLWPATVIESLASKNFKLGNKSLWRKATIIADATVHICQQDGNFTGNMLIDDVFLRQICGYKDDDFIQYRCDPLCEPPRLLDMHNNIDQETRSAFSRGSVHDVSKDIKQAKKTKIGQQYYQQNSKL